MYISQKVFLTFNWVLLPIILRQHKISLSTIGFAALVYSPWALKFLYASIVDRYFNERFGRRKSWIVPLLCISWVILFLAGMLSPFQDLGIILVAIFVLNLMFATVDIAVDGYATDILEAEERSWGNTIQLVAYMLGYMLGAGVCLIIYQSQGWKFTVWMIAILQAFIILPILFHRELPPVYKQGGEISGPAQKVQPSVISYLKQPNILWFLTFLIMIALFQQGGNRLRLPMFVDLGVTSSTIGSVNLWIGSPIYITGAVFGGAAFNAFGARKFFLAGCIGASLVSFVTSWLATQVSIGAGWVALIIGLERFVGGGFNICIGAMIMKASVGRQSATNYALLSSAGHVISFAIMPMAGYICDNIGYVNMYLIIGLLTVFSLFAGDYMLRRRLEYIR